MWDRLRVFLFGHSLRLMIFERLLDGFFLPESPIKFAVSIGIRSVVVLLSNNFARVFEFRIPVLLSGVVLMLIALPSVLPR